jgi:alkaline phosphatase
MRRFKLVLIAAFMLWGSGQTAAQQAPRNVILFISDGCGPASFTMARDYVRDYLGEDGLTIDSLQVGAVRTHAADSRVTDSAAGATVYACGIKTYNGAIAVDTLRRPVATILEAAEAQGMATGLVATSRITHATPAAFSAHVPNRSMEEEIAAQQLQQGVDVIFGGGQDYFVPQGTGGERRDGRNLLEEAQQDGYQVVLTREAFVQPLQTPVLGLFAESHMAYEIDRDTLQEPSLAEMTVKAIDLLKDDPEGFFLMVEGSRIDHAGHANDPAAHLHDILAYDRALAVALGFARQDGQTLLIATSDHETGGLTLGRDVDGRGIYAWYPGVLARVTHSIERMVGAVVDGADAATVLREQAGVDSLTAAEQAIVAQAATEAGQRTLADDLAEMISRRAVVGWTTGGHTAVDVNLYAFGPGSERLVGNHENNYVGQVLIDLFGFDMSALTSSLRQAAESR